MKTCKDCGTILDAFGICPNASPSLAATSVSPVYCGARQEHPAGCICENCRNRRYNTFRIIERAA